MVFSFTTTSSATSGYAPLTLTFQPSSIPLTSPQFLNKVVYQLPGQTVTRTNNFTATPDSTDCRTNLTCTLPSQNNTYVITISAFIGPANFTPTVYTLSATNILPLFTTNPTIGSPKPYVFGEVHLLRSRAWDTSNTQMFLLETNNPNYLLINYNG